MLCFLEMIIILQKSTKFRSTPMNWKTLNRDKMGKNQIHASQITLNANSDYVITWFVHILVAKLMQNS